MDTNRTTYERIAKEFSATRRSVWACVRAFADDYLRSGQKVLEVGCGNGKNLEFLQHRVDVVGIDTCENFVRICGAKGLNVRAGDAREIPYGEATFDAVLCIAMFHHVAEEDRCRAFRDILRVLRVGGVGILTCWSVEQPEYSKFIFSEGLNIVPWNKTQFRYYYVYSETMFREYFQSFSEITIERIYNELGNWVLVFRKV